jgi:uncharacterized OsmC-like protein
MSVQITGRYLGAKKIEVTHGPSGATFKTVAPLDNQGDGSTFSPTDLVATGLGSCLLTIMANYADRNGIALDGASFEVEKVMTPTPPRRIATLLVQLHLPEHLTQAQREALELAAQGCPVHRSLHEAVHVSISYFYDVA